MFHKSKEFSWQTRLELLLYIEVTIVLIIGGGASNGWLRAITKIKQDYFWDYFNRSEDMWVPPYDVFLRMYTRN